MLETFQSLGHFSMVRLLLKSAAREEEMLGAQFLRSLAGIRSGPGNCWSVQQFFREEMLHPILISL